MIPQLRNLSINPRLRRVLVLGLVVTPLAFLFESLVTNFRTVSGWTWQFNTWKVAFSFVFLIISQSLRPLASQWALQAFEQDLPYRRVYAGFFLSEPAKYLPGGLWMIPGRVLTYQTAGVNAQITSLSMGLEIWMTILTSLLASLLVIPWAGDVAWAWKLGMVIGAMFVTSTLGAVLWASGKLNVWLPSRMNHITHKPSVWHVRRLLRLLLAYCIYWLAAGTAFFFLVDSLYRLLPSTWPVMIGIFAASWVAGFLAFLTPAGLGVREGALTLLLAPLLPAPLPALVALLARVWWTAAELICVGVAFFIMHPVRRRQPVDETDG